VAAEQNYPQVAGEVAAHHHSASECQLAPSGSGSSRHTAAVEAEVETEPALLGQPHRTLPSRCRNHRKLRKGLLEGSARSKLPKLRSTVVAQGLGRQ